MRRLIETAPLKSQTHLKTVLLLNKDIICCEPGTNRVKNCVKGGYKRRDVLNTFIIISIYEKNHLNKTLSSLIVKLSDVQAENYRTPSKILERLSVLLQQN